MKKIGLRLLRADTSFLIDLMRKKESALKKLDNIKKTNESQFTISPVVFKLFDGVSMSNWPEKEKLKVIQPLTNFSIIDFNLAHSIEAGNILGELYNIGQPIDPIDAQIGGISRKEDQTIVTKNVKHFDRIANLNVEGY